MLLSRRQHGRLVNESHGDVKDLPSPPSFQFLSQLSLLSVLIALTQRSALIAFILSLPFLNPILDYIPDYIPDHIPDHILDHTTDHIADHILDPIFDHILDHYF
ncbi:hypothetical protein FHG87_003881 [Trinorchestia longiramus]|nr:hypothetical protein FHG87_003881 [Trinorchestia longiramus]